MTTESINYIHHSPANSTHITLRNSNCGDESLDQINYVDAWLSVTDLFLLLVSRVISKEFKEYSVKSL